MIKKTLHHIYNTNNTLLEKIKKNLTLNKHDLNDLKDLPATYLLCYLNGFEEAKEKLEEHRWLIKEYNPSIYISLKESITYIAKSKIQLLMRTLVIGDIHGAYLPLCKHSIVLALVL